MKMDYISYIIVYNKLIFFNLYKIKFINISFMLNVISLNILEFIYKLFFPVINYL